MLTAPGQPAPARRPSILTIVTIAMLLALGVVQAVALVAWWLGPSPWYLDLANHFVVYTAASFACSALLSAAARLYRVTALTCLGLLVFGARACSPAPAHGGEQCTTLLMANVLSHNTDSAALLAYVAATDPDVVGLVEVTPRWLEELAPLRTAYPTYLEVGRNDDFGMALYDRRPSSKMQPETLGGGAVPALSLQAAQGPSVLLLHPLPPVDRTYAAQRDAYLADVQPLLDTALDVAMGDLNVTPWSRRFPGRAPFGHTWPSDLPAPLRLPIDHVIATGEWRVTALDVGPAIGSDHRPITAEVCHFMP